MFPSGLLHINPRKRLILIVSAFAVFLVYAYLHSPPPRAAPRLDLAATNRTLGFGVIYVLTEDTTTWRIQGLKQAAKLAGLSLTVPVQPRRSDEEVSAFLAGDAAKTVFDEIRAVLNYVSLLERFVSSGRETALFVEDDVDFSIHIKSQMLNISNIRLGIKPDTIHYEPSWTEEIDPIHQKRKSDPYDLFGWDVLWLGHFGLEYTRRTKLTKYTDPYALPWNQLFSKYNNYYQLKAESMNARYPQSLQQDWLSNIAPIGSYGFALTRATAEGLIRKIRNERKQQFDFVLHSQCKAMELRCLAPAPGIMYHHKVHGQKSIQNAGNLNEGKHTLTWARKRHKYTHNIEWSARCNAAGVGEKVGNRWQCLPNKYDEDL